MRESRRLRGRTVAVIAAAGFCLLAPAASSAATTWVVTLTGNDMDTAQFTPKFLTIQVGDTVSWVNHDGVHNVVADDGSFLSGPVEPPDGPDWPFKVRFTKAGTNPYYCSIHGNIGGVGQSGVIYVRPAHPASDVVYEKSAWDFTPVSPTLTFGLGPQPEMRWATATAPQEVQAGVQLPSGAKITGLEITGCDDDDAHDMVAALLECPDPSAQCTTIATAGSNGQPGCDFFASTGVTTQTNVDNLTNTYALDLMIGGQFLKFRNVRIFYQRLVSPAPATATFADVPTNNQFFKVIEALAASGITQGCGNGNFCPNDPVTRGSMASFLARALGLFWAN
jgi:plastocyanin